MNSAVPPCHRRQRRKSSLMTRIVLLVSFVLLAARLVFVIPGAISHYQQKQQVNASPVTVTSDSDDQ